jgi:hypothetical protein
LGTWRSSLSGYLVHESAAESTNPPEAGVVEGKRRDVQRRCGSEAASLPAGEGYHEPHCPRFLSRGGDCLQNAMWKQEQFLAVVVLPLKGTGIETGER